MAITQAHRTAAIKTPLGADVLVLRRFSGTEQMSRLFQFEVDLLSEKHDINFDDIIGQKVTVRLAVKDQKTRYFHGHVSRFVQAGSEGKYARYQATIVPWLWFLTRTADCRIFQNKTIPEILEAVFKGHGFDSYELGLHGSYKPWEYCVQYRETDFNFVSRLMEQEGIYYFFKHEDGKHKLILADSASAHEDCPGYGQILYRPPDDSRPSEDEIDGWVINKELQTGTFAHTDFNFEKPKTNLAGKSNVPRQHAAADFEIFDYPGEHEEADEGESYAKLRIQELQAQYEIVQGQATARGIAPGFTFKLKDHPREDQNRKYLVLSASYSIEEDLFDSGGNSGGYYRCAFSVMDAGTPYRAARLTPKPIVQGPQTAIVVGPAGAEIYTDKHARVKVQFHWDRYGKRNENSSCWIRVSQPWAGKGFGGTNIPRIGQEVIVEFLEGDPDRPVINGRVYNADSMPYGSKAGKPELDRIQEKQQLAALQTKVAIAPPSRAGGGGGGGAPASAAGPILSSVAAALAGVAIAPLLAKLGKAFQKKQANPAQASIVDSAMMTTIKSNSLGGSGGSSEITLSDIPGGETLFIKAERDMVVSVNNDQTTTVDKNAVFDITGNCHTMIKGKDTQNVGQESATTVGGRYSLTVSKSAVVKIKGVEQHSVGGNHELTVKRDAVTTVERDVKTNITGKESHEVAKDSSLRIGGNQTTEIKGDDKLTVEKTETIEVKDKIKVAGNKTIEVEGADEIVLKCGSASVTLKKSGDVEIKGTNIKLEATAKLEEKGASVSSEASADNSVKGAIVKINS